MIFFFSAVSTPFPNKLFLSFKFCRTIRYLQGQLQVPREVLNNACAKVGLNRITNIMPAISISIAREDPFCLCYST